MKSKTNPLEFGFHAFFLGCGVLSVGLVLLISAYLVFSGVPAMVSIGPRSFLLGEEWVAGAEKFGILPFILTSIWGTAGAVALGVPLGLLTAVFLAKDAPAGLARMLHTAVELLAGIPSVVYGLVGMMVLVPAMQRLLHLPSGACLLTAMLVLTIMILPYIISVSEAALRAVPREYEEASLALGATDVETWFRVSIPAARRGIVTAVVQGIGRAIGEAMAIIMVSGNVVHMPGLTAPVRFLTTAIASEMSYAVVGSLHQQALFSIGLVLFLFILLMGAFLHLVVRREDK